MKSTQPTVRFRHGPPRPRVVLTICLCLGLSVVGRAQDEVDLQPTPDPLGTTLKLKDGSAIRGQILQMTENDLKMQTQFGGEVPVNWSEVSQMFSKLKLRLHLQDDSILHGTVEEGDEDTIHVRVADTDQLIPVKLSAVKAINPPPEKVITYKGNINLGATITDGNTQTKAVAANGEFVARSKRQRLTLRAATNYAEDSDGVTARNSRGSIKYDFFLTEKWYLFAGALFEGDSFQDLNLRTALSGGVGYQFLDKGELEHAAFKGLEGYAEIGLAYFSEDYDTTPDTQFVSGKWALKLDWELKPDQITAFHYHEGYPGFEDLEDLYILTEQGVRFTLYGNFIATIQVNWRWDNTPSSGFERSDTIYLITLGYNFDL